MVAGSADPPPPERPQQERYGILELLRTRKDDGRALLLYSHDEPDGDGERPPQTPTHEGERA
ncbi:MAG TPA: hypothetical protein VHT25_04900 [Solirubrobacteraceae bacterium]|jgi:hypothetical protein|nr:hypothetical protein [Solirubrobacteraceae bacterium]